MFLIELSLLRWSRWSGSTASYRPEQPRFILASGRKISGGRLFAEFPLKFLKYYLVHRQILNGWFGLSVASTAANRNFMRLAKAKELQMLAEIEEAK